MDFQELIDCNKIKTEFDKNNMLHLLEMFVMLKFPDIKELDIRFDKKGESIWLKFKKHESITKEMVQEEIYKMKKELDHYAANRK